MLCLDLIYNGAFRINLEIIFHSYILHMYMYGPMSLTQSAYARFSTKFLTGPVFVLQLFGLCDVSGKLLLSGCPVWVTLGTLIISASFAFILFALWKIHHLIKREALQWNKFEHRTVKQIYTDAMAMPGLLAKFLSFFVSIHERRFLGEWSIDKNANLWGFLLAETGALYYCFALRMGKIILVAMVLNLEIPSMPLVPPFILLFLYFFGTIEGFKLCPLDLERH